MLSHPEKDQADKAARVLAWRQEMEAKLALCGDAVVGGPGLGRDGRTLAQEADLVRASKGPTKGDCGCEGATGAGQVALAMEAALAARKLEKRREWERLLAACGDAVVGGPGLGRDGRTLAQEAQDTLGCDCRTQTNPSHSLKELITNDVLQKLTKGRDTHRAEKVAPFDPSNKKVDSTLEASILGRFHAYIYTSAGPGDVNASASCRAGATGGSSASCSLYRIAVYESYTHPGTYLLGRVILVASPWAGLGAIQPAVSPNGSDVAFLVKNDTITFLCATDASGGNLRLLKVATRNKPEFPNWYDNGTLLYHSGDEDGKTLSMMYVNAQGGFNDTPVFGPDGAPETHDWSFQDPNTARDGSGRIVSFGGKITRNTDETTTIPLIPFVHGLVNTDREAFDVGTNVLNNNAIEMCHHPAWNPSGDRISCSEQGQVEGNSQNRYKLLYNYEFENGTWVQTRPKWPLPWAGSPLPWGGPELPLPPPFDGDGFLYTLKYAEWCASDDAMIVTLYSNTFDNSAGRPTYGTVTLRSRVYLVYRPFSNQFSTPEPLVWLDLTGHIAEVLGEDDNAFNGVYGTCSGVSP